MPQPLISFSNRLRRTPFSRRVEAAGAVSYNIYNHTVQATAYRSMREDYAHLKTAVQVWDVSCEKQVEIIGRDARHLIQMTTPRDLGSMQDDQCYYIPMVDERGAMLNDPVLNKLAGDRYWVSLSDSDMLYYFKGLANGFGLDVRVFEPDVFPLAIQGPRADELIRRVFGQEIVDTRFFRHKPITFNGQQMIIARSGWSRQGGFEIYMVGFKNGEALWDTLFDAGEDLDLRAGCPNLIERIEGGLLSYGNDITIDHTPFEVGLGKYCNLQTATGCLGHAALLDRQKPTRQIRPISIAGDPISEVPELWPLKNLSGQPCGSISSATWSPDFNTNVAIGMVDRADWQPGTRLLVDTHAGTREAVVQAEFWI